ncbi:MAG: hypothetical protein H8K09_11650 [Nitrospira sp.]|nr:hypothetical protein [Nitrospira sp.]
MPSSHHRPARLDHILRGWVVFWLLALPLFHIHPETDPHHGEAGHVHAAAVHTVFSGDLEGEFGKQRKPAVATPHTDAEPAVSAEGPHAWSTDPELGLSLLNDATDRKFVKPLLTHILFVAHPLLSVPDSHDRPQEEQSSSPATRLFTRDVPARAPPSPLLS